MQLIGMVGKLGRSLGVDVVVEGIETIEALRAVTKLGAGYAQGRFLSWPVTNAEVESACGTGPARHRGLPGLRGRGSMSAVDEHPTPTLSIQPRRGAP